MSEHAATGGMGSHAAGDGPVHDDRDARERPIGELVKDLSQQTSTLVRKEIELARAELQEKGKVAGKGAGMLGGAGFAGLFALVFLSISAAYGIAWLGVPLGCAFFTVGLLYVLAAAVLALGGKKNLQKVGPPERTIETVKDDVAFAKNPTNAPTRRTSV